MGRARRITANRGESPLVSGEHDPVFVAAFIARRYALAGQKLVNPILGFNREFRDSCDAGGRLEPTSYLGRISAARFARERSHAETVANLIWDGESRLAAEDVLRRLFAADGVVKGGLGRAWQDCPAILSFVESAAYMHNCRVLEHDAEKEGIMAQTKGRKDIVLRGCQEMFGCAASIQNPLVALRRRDAAGLASFAVADERAQAVAELEGLSQRVWGFKTCVDMGSLVARLMLEADGGEHDLALIDKHLELIRGDDGLKDPAHAYEEGGAHGATDTR